MTTIRGRINSLYKRYRDKFIFVRQRDGGHAAIPQEAMLDLVVDCIEGAAADKPVIPENPHFEKVLNADGEHAEPVGLLAQMAREIADKAGKSDEA